MNKRQKILIVDDAKFNRDILKEFLGETYDYLEAENGNQAVQIMEENPGIDLMLLDINMPQMDGFEVLKWMKLSQCVEETPVIMISSEESVETMRKAYEMGITDYITRPFDSVIVKKRVQNTLGLYANQKRLINVVVDQVYEKEENNKIFKYQLLPSENVSKPFSCLGEKRTITFTIIQKTLIDDILDSEVPIIPKDVSIEFDKTLFSDIETKIKGDQVVLNITSNINKEDKILNVDLQISYSTINGIKVEKIPLIIDKGKLTFVYKIHSEQNPFVLPVEGGKFELPFICKKQTYLNDQFIEETYSSLNGLRFKTISTGNVWFLTVRKDGEKIGFYKFTFVGEGPYNQKTDPECYFNIYTHDANLITDNPTEIFRQDFIQPQTPGEDYYKPSRSSYKHGTFDF